MEDNVMDPKNKRTKALFSKAIREARRSECNYRLGAIIVQRRKELARAHNIYRTHPLTNNHNMNALKMKGLHAEIAVCLKVSKSQLEGADVYVARILKNNSLALSRPCDICRSVLSKFGVSRVFYSIANNEYGVISL